MEEKVFIPVGENILEGRLAVGDGPGAGLITHPHPLFGGSMDNNVVWTVKRAGEERRWTMLRFNFRGVGQSTGKYGEGVEEVADVAAALNFLKGRAGGPYYVIGYSFGAAVAARALLQGLEADGLWLIAPPIAFMEMNFLPQTPRLQLIVVGEADSLCPQAQLHTILAATPAAPSLVVIPGADHFFVGQEDKLFQILRDYEPR